MFRALSESGAAAFQIAWADEESIVAQQDLRSPFRMLYVEDNALVREITCELLANDAREVIAVGSAEEALAALKEHRFDIVVTDVSLPVMSGIELAKQIRRLVPALPVILASGHPLDMADLRLGATVRAIRKPFDTQQLEAMIQDLSASGAAADPASA
jgi:CheY-like chemotaxis protein